MSMILDAIKRSRDEQREQSVMPNVDSQHFVAEPVSHRPYLLAMGAIILVAGLIAILVLLASDRSAIEPAEKADSATPVDRVTSSLKAPAVGDSNGSSLSATRVKSMLGPDAQSRARTSFTSNKTVQQRATTQTITGVDPSVAALYAGIDQLPKALESSADSPTIVDVAPSGSIANDLAQGTHPSPGIEAASAASRGARRDEEAIDVQSVLERAQRALGERQLLPHATPLLENLSQQTKDAIPSVFYTVHQYDENGGDSIVINGQRVAVGGRAQGFTVKEILPDSAILSWGSTDFRLRALNSWVNL